MKKYFTLLAFAMILALTFSSQATAQAPLRFSYQAVVRDAANELVADAGIGMRVSILQGSAAGSSVYTETHVAESNLNGLVTIVIGDGTTADDMATIDWSAGPYFLKVETDPNGGTSYTITSTTQLMSVPYAQYAEKSGDSFSGVYNDLSGKPDLSGMVEVSGASDGDILYYNSGQWNTLAKGSDKQVLTLNSGVPMWKTPGTTAIQTYFQFVTYKSGSSTPIAFGFINADGTIYSGSGNFTCTWNSGAMRYEIAITGENYFWRSYTTVATVAQQSAAANASIQIGSVGGSLLVHIYQ